MSTIAAAPPYTEAGEKSGTGIWSWLTTVDHKRIGVLSAEQYNQLFTMHGTTMIFLVIMPLSAAFFNFLIPLQIGARDVAFPRLNAFSYWVYLFGSLFLNAGWLIGAAPDGGWFGYAPLTTLTYAQN